MVEALSPQALTDLAIAAAGKALRAGRPSEAVAYIRVAEALQRLLAPEIARAADRNYIHPDELEQRVAELRARTPQILALVEEKCGYRPEPREG